MKTEEEYEQMYEEQEAAKVTKKDNKDNIVASAILASTIILAGTWIYTSSIKAGSPTGSNVATQGTTQPSELEEKVLPSGGVILPVKWGDLGAKLVSEGP